MELFFSFFSARSVNKYIELLLEMHVFLPVSCGVTMKFKKIGVVLLPLKTWWLFLSSVWRPPHSFFRSCRVSCCNSLATSLTERLPGDKENDEGQDRQRSRRRSFNVTFINTVHTLLQACTEIIYRLRKKHPIQLIGLSPCLNTEFFCRRKKKKNFTHCTSVLVRAVKYEN